MKVKDYTVSGEEFTLQYYQKYNCLQTYPIPQNLNTYYQSPNYISHTDSKSGIVSFLYQLIKKFTISQKLRLITKFSISKGSILDIGAGTASFLIHCKQKGWNVSGVEPSPIARQNAINKGIQLQENISQIHSSYDVITLWHVLEHILDLENQITFIKKHLNTNGTLVIAVPNYNSKDAQIYGPHWAAYDVPRHLWHFSQQSIKTIFNPHGFEIVAIKPMYFDSFYVSILSEKYKTGKSNLFKAFFNGLISNISALKTSEYSSLIYILKKKEV